MDATVTAGWTWVDDEALDYDKLRAAAVPSVVIAPQPLFFAAATGTGSAYELVLSPAAEGLVDGLTVWFRVPLENTGAVTANVDGLGAFQIKKGNQQVLDAGDLRAGMECAIIWDATNADWQLLSGVWNPWAVRVVVATGALNTFAVTLSDFPAAYALGQRVAVQANLTNTGAATLNVNGLGAKAIVQQSGAALASGMLMAGQVFDVIYDGTRFQLLSGASAGTAFVYAVSASGSDTYAVTLSPAPSALTDGLLVWLKVDVGNTGAATLNVNGLGAKAIKKGVSRDLDSGDLVAGQQVALIYDLTNTVWQLTSGLPHGATQIYSGLASVTGTDAYACTAAPVPAALVEGMQAWFRPDVANTGAATFNLNALGAKQIVRRGGAGLSDNDIAAATLVGLVYDGTALQWQLIDSPAAAVVTKYSAVDSAALSVNFAADGTLVKGHGLGAMPAMVRAVLVCLSAELGYAVNEEVDAWNANTVAGATLLGLSADATNVTVTVSAVATYLMTKGSSAYAAIDRAKWKLKVYAWL